MSLAHTPPSIADQLLSLKQDANTYGSSPLLMAIDLDMIRRFEALACCDEYARALCKRLRSNLAEGIQDIARIRQLYNAFAEGRAFYELLDKGIAIGRVAERSEQTADFLIVHDTGEHLFAEVKALSMEGGDAKYDDIMQTGLNNRVEADSKLRNRSMFVLTEQIISPLGSLGIPADPFSLRLVTEAIINKACGLIKSRQLQAGKTILVLDVGQLALGCTHSQSLLPDFLDTTTKSHGTGVLFAAAFGVIGQPMSRTSEFEGQAWASGNDGMLTQEGVFRQFPVVDGILFRCGWSPAEYLGLVKAGASDAVRSVVIKASDKWNDEVNAQAITLS